MKVVIIGAGVGGLAAAIALAQKGYKVEIYEKNSTTGGKAGVLNAEGFRFDTGPTVATMIEVLESVFMLAGEKIEDYVNIKKQKISCRYFYEDGIFIDAYNNIDKLANEIDEKTLDIGDKIRAYFKYCEKLYHSVAKTFLFHEFKAWKTFWKSKPLTLPFKLINYDFLQSMSSVISSYFRDDKVRKIFNRFATYNGSDPYKAPSTLNVISYVEIIMGSYEIMGGMYEIPKALTKLAQKLGVKITCDASVEEILYQNGKAFGIKLESEVVLADIVVSNVDAFTTRKELLEEPFKPVHPLSSSGIVFLWGIKTSEAIKAKFLSHNIIFTENQEQEFRDLTDNRIVPNDPTIYIHISQKYNPDDAPEGFENWFVMINSPAIGNKISDLKLKEIKAKILKRIEKNTGLNLTNSIVYEKIQTPHDFELSTGSYHGALYGYASNSFLSFFHKESPKAKDYENLYFCGGTTHPGGGVPLAIQSGILTANKIVKQNPL